MPARQTCLGAGFEKQVQPLSQEHKETVFQKGDWKKGPFMDEKNKQAGTSARHGHRGESNHGKKSDPEKLKAKVKGKRSFEDVKGDPDLQRKGWIVLFAMLFCGIIVIMNQYKVPVFMPALMHDFHTDPGTTGWLMSVIAVAGIVTAFPSAFLLNRFGPKIIGLIGIAFMVLGCTVGALSAEFWQLIVGRILEGIGVAMMGVVATTIISMYFPREKAGLPMGIWNLWYVVGSTLAYNIGVPVALALTGNSQNWHAWWWFSDILALLAFVVFALFVQKPRTNKDKAMKSAGVHRPSIVEGFKVPRMWIFGLGFCFLMFTALAVLTWVPTYVQGIELNKLLATGMGMGEAQATAGITAGSMASIGFAASIPMAIVTALLLGKFQTIRSRKVMVVVAGFAAFFYVGAFLIPYEYLPYYLILLGFESGWTSGVVWSMVPITMPKRITMPIGMAIIIFFQGVSNLLCTPIVGYVIGPQEVWVNVAPLCAVTAAIGTILWIVYAATKAPVFEEDEDDGDDEVAEAQKAPLPEEMPSPA